MKDIKESFAVGLKDGIAMWGAAAVTTVGGIVLLVLLLGLQLWMLLGWLIGIKRASFNALKEARVDLGWHTITDSYQYWYEKFTKKD